MQIQQRKLKISECSVEFNTSDVVEFSQFECVIFGCRSACKTACDVEEVKVEQISGTSRALKKMKKHILDNDSSIRPRWNGRTPETERRLQLKLVKLTTVNNKHMVIYYARSLMNINKV